jgi:hypothetical protein
VLLFGRAEAAQGRLLRPATERGERAPGSNRHPGGSSRSSGGPDGISRSGPGSSMPRSTGVAEIRHWVYGTSDEVAYRGGEP